MILHRLIDSMIISLDPTIRYIDDLIIRKDAVNQIINL